MTGNKTIGILCTTASLGGLELNTLKLALWLREEGWKPVLLLRTENPLIERAQSANAEYHLLPPASGPLRHWIRAKAVGKWLKSSGARLLFTPFNKDIATATLCKRFFSKGLKVVYQQQMQVGVPKCDLIHTIRYAPLDAWISPLPYLKEETLRLTKVPERKIIIIPLGMELQPFLNNPYGREEARKALGLPLSAHIIGILGRLDRNKAQDFIVRALRQWNLDHPEHPYHLLLMGDATPDPEGHAFRQNLINLISSGGMQSQVTMVPHGQDILLFYRAIDIFAMPSLSETFGMVTIEAMTSGVPVIGAGRAGTKALLQDGRLGYLYTPGDEPDFLLALQKLQADKSLPQRLRQATEEVKEKYSKEVMIQGMNALFTRLLEQ